MNDIEPSAKDLLQNADAVKSSEKFVLLPDSSKDRLVEPHGSEFGTTQQVTQVAPVKRTITVSGML